MSRPRASQTAELSILFYCSINLQSPCRGPIEADRVIMEELSLLLLAPAADDALEGLDPLFVRGRQGANGPIASKEDAVRPKHLKGVVHDGREIGGGPFAKLGGS